eukprot:XP_001709250.1 Hypothetical protein GL50803_32212 [Giardia lamblia ATCC 50803]
MLNGFCGVFKARCFVDLLQMFIDVVHNSCHPLCYITHLCKEPIDGVQDIHGAGIKFTWGAVSSQLIPYDFQIEAIDRRDLLADNVANALYHEVGYHPGDEFSKYLLEAASKCPP